MEPMGGFYGVVQTIFLKNRDNGCEMDVFSDVFRLDKNTFKLTVEEMH